MVYYNDVGWATEEVGKFSLLLVASRIWVELSEVGLAVYCIACSLVALLQYQL